MHPGLCRTSIFSGISVSTLARVVRRHCEGADCGSSCHHRHRLIGRLELHARLKKQALSRHTGCPVPLKSALSIFPICELLCKGHPAPHVSCLCMWLCGLCYRALYVNPLSALDAHLAIRLRRSPEGSRESCPKHTNTMVPLPHVPAPSLTKPLLPLLGTC